MLYHEPPISRVVHFIPSYSSSSDRSMGLFGGKGELSLANQAAHEDSTEAPQANKASHGKYEDRKFNGNCDHCKKHGHKKSQCWILHPHLKPAKFMKEREGRANVTEGSSGAGTSKIDPGLIGTTEKLSYSQTGKLESPD